MRVLGIDPGLRITGYGCIESVANNGSRAMRGRLGREMTLVEAGVIRLTVSRGVADRLLELHRDATELIERVRPDAVAIEKLYAHYKHPTTAIAMGHARGVLLLAVRAAGLVVVELAATEVKKSTTGNGHAGKAQMQDAVRAQLDLPSRPEPADVADAIAIAMCGLRRELARGRTGMVGAP